MKTELTMAKFMQDIYKEKEQEKLRDELQRKELYLANKKMLNERKQEKIRKSNLIKKRVKTVVVASGLVTIGAMTFFGYQQFKGSERIANQFLKYTTDYGISNQSYGYVAISGGQQISLDSAFYDMINDARYGGMTDSEIYVGISKMYGSGLAREYVGDVSLEERIATNQKAYAQELAEEYGVEINLDKVSGGIKK